MVLWPIERKLDVAFLKSNSFVQVEELLMGLNPAMGSFHGKFLYEEHHSLDSPQHIDVVELSLMNTGWQLLAIVLMSE